jgi:putative ABC transport system substrate-binding protein
MRRRDLFGAVCGMALAAPIATAAQQAGKVWRIGDLYIGTPEVARIYAEALERSLADLGYVQGRNIVLLVRYTGPQREEMQEAIISLLPQVDLLVVRGNAAIEAKKLAGAVPDNRRGSNGRHWTRRRTTSG